MISTRTSSAMAPTAENISAYNNIGTELYGTVRGQKIINPVLGILKVITGHLHANIDKWLFYFVLFIRPMHVVVKT